jgi:hypothetical protein
METVTVIVTEISIILRGWNTCANGEALAYVHVMGCIFGTTQGVDPFSM